MDETNLLSNLRKDPIIFIAAILILLLRLVFIPLMGPMPQDAYYYFYSKHPALSYFDHPPAIAYLLRLFTAIFGRHVFALKLADSVVTLFSLIAFYKLGKCFLSRDKAQRALLLFFSTFMVTVLSLVSTPDTPLILFWTLSLISLYYAVFLEKNIYWVWSGILMGFAFDSKYTALLLSMGLVCFLIVSKAHRKKLLSPWLWLSLLLFVITISPVIIWNVQNGFASFKFQSSTHLQTEDTHHFDINNFLGVIGHQSAIMLPVLFLSFFWILFKLIKKYKIKILSIDDKQLFLLSFFIPAFAGFLAISFLFWVKLNWMMPAYISGIILVSIYLSKKWIKAQVIISAILHLLVSAEVLFYPIPVRSDDTWAGWKELSQQVEVLETSHPGSFIFSADDYKTSAMLNFYLGKMVYGRNVIGEPALQFDYIGTDLKTLAGKDALFIDSDPHFKNESASGKIPTSLTAYFDTVREIDPLLIKKGGQTIRKFFVYECRGYHPH